MKLALAQMNPTVGDLVRNADKIIDFARRAGEAEVTTVIFPELALLGYPPKDLLLKDGFIAESLRQLDRIARETSELELLVGYAERNDAPTGRDLFNAVAKLSGGAVQSRHYKSLLPAYDVFDESRYFEPAGNACADNVVTLAGEKVGVSICEDLWNDDRLMGRRLYNSNPIRQLRECGARLLINVSASPYVADKHAFRLKLIASQISAVGVPLVYVNQVGGNDELIFDGSSCVLDCDGKLIAQAKAFEEDLLFVEVEPGGAEQADDVCDGDELDLHEVDIDDAGPNRIEIVPSGIESMHDGLVLGLRDYVEKCGFSKVALGLSGGIDSALTCALAVKAFGPEHVTGVAMPSRYSSDHSIADAKALADNLGMTAAGNYHVVPIEPMHAGFEAGLDGVLDLTGLTDENLQARIRGATMMAFSNKTGALLLTTGNKSELAVGYCTLYGDMCGGLAVINDLPKTDVYAMCRFINDRAGREVVPESTITKPPSAELAPDQKDSDSLPPYDVLDAILERYVEDDASPASIVEAGFDEETVKRVVKLVDRSEFKRRQAAPGLKVTSRAFGFGRRMPIAQRYSPSMTSRGTPAPTV